MPPQLAAHTQAEWLRELEQADAVATAALAGFTAGQGYAGDAEYSAVSWLMHRTRITRGAWLEGDAAAAITCDAAMASVVTGDINEEALGPGPAVRGTGRPPRRRARRRMGGARAGGDR